MYFTPGLATYQVRGFATSMYPTVRVEATLDDQPSTDVVFEMTVETAFELAAKLQYQATLAVTQQAIDDARLSE